MSTHRTASDRPEQFVEERAGKQEKSQSPVMCVGLKDVTANSSDSRPVFHQSHPLIVFRSKYIFVFCFVF